MDSESHHFACSGAAVGDMKHAHALGWLLVPLAVLTGCNTALKEEEDELLGLLGSSIVGDNALVPNALVPNALVPNALVPNALVPNALVPNALAAIRDPAYSGELSREFLRYTVGCALETSQSFTFSWTDALGVPHQETYLGVVGLAPGWASGPLDANDQQMISACLAARTNWYSVPVTISMRSHENPLRTKVHSSEVAAYPDVEGAFWGNLFTPTPTLRACFNDQTITNSRSHQRDCAVGHLNAQGGVESCGLITIVGRCQDYCKGLHPTGRYYQECTDPTSGKTKLVITAALL
jgi:hypothetical protein